VRSKREGPHVRDRYLVHVQRSRVAVAYQCARRYPAHGQNHRRLRPEQGWAWTFDPAPARPGVDGPAKRSLSVGQPRVARVSRILGENQQLLNLRVEALYATNWPPSVRAEYLAGLVEYQPDYNVRIAAAEALGKIGPTASNACAALGTALRDEWPFVRASAAKALGQIRLPRDRVVGLLRAALHDASAQVQVKAFLVTERRATRDYVDVAALAEHLGDTRAARALNSLNLLHTRGTSQTIITRFAEACESEPADLAATPLASYKSLKAPFSDFEFVAKVCQRLGRALLKRELKGALPGPPAVDTNPQAA
jgi:HEAT repeats